MKPQRRLLLIENQFVQFDQILSYLKSANFSVYPANDQFKNFLDRIRVFLNERYDISRREKAFKDILVLLDDFKPELLIIDHILVGNHSAKNGIDLAQRLRKEKFKQPILFLSRTEQNHVDVCKHLPDIDQKTLWISKGYLGEDILDKDFFQKEVIENINLLLVNSALENSNAEILKDINPYLTDLLNTQKESHSRSPSVKKNVSIANLELLIVAFDKFIEKNEIISEGIRQVFLDFKKSTANADFGETGWNNLCCGLIKMLE